MIYLDEKKQAEIILPQIYESIRHVATRRHIYLNIFLMIIGGYWVFLIKVLTNGDAINNQGNCLNNLFKKIGSISGANVEFLYWSTFIVFLITSIFLCISFRHYSYLQVFRENIGRMTGEYTGDKDVLLKEGTLEMIVKYLIMILLIAFTYTLWISRKMPCTFILIITESVIFISLSFFQKIFRKKLINAPPHFIVPKHLISG